MQMKHQRILKIFTRKVWRNLGNKNRFILTTYVSCIERRNQDKYFSFLDQMHHRNHLRLEMTDYMSLNPQNQSKNLQKSFQVYPLKGLFIFGPLEMELVWMNFKMSKIESQQLKLYFWSQWFWTLNYFSFVYIHLYAWCAKYKAK